MSVEKCFEGNKNQSLTVLLKNFMLIMCNTYYDEQFITMYGNESNILKKNARKYFRNERYVL